MFKVMAPRVDVVVLPSVVIEGHQDRPIGGLKRTI
jgi:hypothetical protein